MTALGPVKVLFIVGWPRSGSTLLDTLLGQVPGAVSVGEIKFIWERSVRDNRYCGCGRPFRQCDFWTEVFRSAFGGFEALDGAALDRASRWARTRTIPLMMLPGSRRLFGRRLAAYLGEVERLYRGIASVSDGGMVIDSSKFPSYLYLLQLVPGFDLRVVHLVRDPRAVAFSWMREKVDPDSPEPKMMPRMRPHTTSLGWDLWNLAAERLGGADPSRYLRVRYEDVVAAPQASIKAILIMADHPSTDLPFVEDRAAEMVVNHTISGNPIRFNTGTVRLGLDDEWRTSMSPSARAVVAALTRPLRARYGYRDR